MLSAREAKNKTIIKTECLNILKKIEEEINTQIEKGRYTAEVRLLHEKEENIAILTEQLEDLGYKVNYAPARPLPPGCPSDQWDFYSTLSVTWR